MYRRLKPNCRSASGSCSKKSAGSGIVDGHKCYFTTRLTRGEAGGRPRRPLPSRLTKKRVTLMRLVDPLRRADVLDMVDCTHHLDGACELRQNEMGGLTPRFGNLSSQLKNLDEVTQARKHSTKNYYYPPKALARLHREKKEDEAITHHLLQRFRIGKTGKHDERPLSFWRRTRIRDGDAVLVVARLLLPYRFFVFGSGFELSLPHSLIRFRVQEAVPVVVGHFDRHLPGHQ